MTQKELLYVEDTLNHLKFISTQINDACDNVNEELCSFLTEINEKITNKYDELLELLER